MKSPSLARRGDAARRTLAAVSKLRSAFLREQAKAKTEFHPAFEALEIRCLMAGDTSPDWSTVLAINANPTPPFAAMVGQPPMHNAFNAEDVNDDGQCSPI